MKALLCSQIYLSTILALCFQSVMNDTLFNMARLIWPAEISTNGRSESRLHIRSRMQVHQSGTKFSCSVHKLTRTAKEFIVLFNWPCQVMSHVQLGPKVWDRWSFWNASLLHFDLMHFLRSEMFSLTINATCENDSVLDARLFCFNNGIIGTKPDDLWASV